MKGRNDTYTVGVASATLGDIPLPLPENATAWVDTGTSLAYLPEAFVRSFQQALATPTFCEELGLPHVCPTEEDPHTIFDGKCVRRLVVIIFEWVDSHVKHARGAGRPSSIYRP